MTPTSYEPVPTQDDEDSLDDPKSSPNRSWRKILALFVCLCLVALVFFKLGRSSIPATPQITPLTEKPQTDALEGQMDTPDESKEIAKHGHGKYSVG